MSSIKTHTFNGTRYCVEVKPDGIDGCCDTPSNRRWLYILVPLNTQRGLITAIHEAMHACEPRKSEESVDRISKDIGRLLWRLGYRNDTH